MKRVKNNTADRVVLYALAKGREEPYVVPPLATVLLPDEVFKRLAPPSAYTEKFRSGGFSTGFPLGEDIDLDVGVTVTIDGRKLSAEQYVVQERPGQITFTKPVASGAEVEITYTNWPNEAYIEKGMITVA